MKLKLTFVLSLALLVGACSDNDPNSVPLPDEDTKTVYIQFKTNAAGARADEPTADGTAAPLLSALVYFLDATNVIQDVRVVTDVATLQDAGVEFNGVPAAATTVYVVGNYNSSDEDGDTADFPTFTGQAFSDVTATVLDIQQVAYPALDGTAANGGDLLTVMTNSTGVVAPLVSYTANPGGWQGSTTTGIANGDFYANVTTSPVNSRIEIGSIVYTGTLQSITLEGIYINNYYQTLPLSMSADPANITNNGSTVANYDVDNAAFAYEDYSVMFDTVDEDFTLVAGTGTLTPDNGSWAYHVFPVGTQEEVPHIILKLTDLVAADGVTALGTRYITVTGFLLGGVPVEEFERNTIYRITSISFDDEDLTILPETPTVSIWVHVEVLDWVTVDVTPVI